MLCLILILVITPQPVTPIFPLVIAAVTAAYTAYQVANDAHDTYVKVTTKSTDDIYEQVKDLSNDLQNAEVRIQGKMDDIYNKLITELPRIIERNSALTDLSKKIARIDHWYKKFSKLYRKPKRVLNRKARSFAKIITSDRPGHVLELLNEIKEDVLPEGTKGLRTGVMELMIGSNSPQRTDERWPCDIKFGRHGIAFPLYKLLFMAEMKAAIMVGISYVVRGIFENEDYIAEVEYEQENTRERIEAYLAGLSKSESTKQRSTQKCPPQTNKYTFGYHYREFVRFQSIYVLNQKDMYDSPNCKHTCNSSESAVTRQVSCENSECTDQDVCRGHISDCTESFYRLLVCKPTSDVAERYQQIENYDKNEPCDNAVWLYSAADSDNNVCPVCMCKCTEDDYMSYAARIVSFQERLSDIDNNYVIVNVLFLFWENTTCLEIVQGLIKPEGYVSIDLDKVDPIDILQLNWPETVENKKLMYYAQRKESNQTVFKRLEERKDYGALTLDENIFNLDDIILPVNYVLTGVRWNYKKVDEGPSPIQLEVRGTLYDYLTGKLILDAENSSIWMTADDMKGKLPEYDRPRGEIQVPTHSDPRSATGKFDFISSPNYFISVQASERDVAEGQLVLPLILTDAVVEDQVFALGGIGIAYEAYDFTTAGFLFLRMYEYDWSGALQFPDVESAYDALDEEENANDNENKNEDEDENSD